MKLTSLAVVLSMMSIGEAGPAGERVPQPTKKDAPKLERWVKKLLPKGWTLETKNLPDGVAGMALGPLTAAGRAVVMLSVLKSQPDVSELATTRGRAFVAGEVDRSGGVGDARYTPAASMRGATEFAATAAKRGEEDREVRYLVSSGKPSYLLTIVAPKSTFAETYQQVVQLATRMRRSTNKR